MPVLLCLFDEIVCSRTGPHLDVVQRDRQRQAWER
jgi:hypothetical protein